MSLEKDYLKDLFTDEVKGCLEGDSSLPKVTSLSASSTDTQYPSAKCVYDMIGNVEALLAAL